MKFVAAGNSYEQNMLIENNGGKINVTSELNKGSYFEIQLPICSV